MPSISHAGNVGHYYNCAGQGTTAMATAITASGNTPINVLVPDAATLAGLDVLWINRNYANNGSCSATPDDEWNANLPAITAAIQAHGLVLVMNDRVVSEPGYNGATTALPNGGSGISFIVEYTSNIDFPAGSPLLSGTGGALDNNSLDGGNNSAHGYATAASLPAGSRILANNGTADHAVIFTYPFGTGTIMYSTIPLDFYLESDIPPAAFKSSYALNMVNYAASISDNEVSEPTTCASEGYKNTQLTWCKNICESTLTGKVLDSWIHRWIERYRQLPYCAVGGLPD